MERQELIAADPELTNMILTHISDKDLTIIDGLGQILSVAMAITKEILKETGNPTGEIVKVINTGTTLEITNDRLQ